MKILFCGWGRSGKDEGAKHLAKITGLRYAGSFSWAGLPFMANYFGLHPCQVWEERHQYRDVWKRQLDHLRTLDQCCLARMTLQTGDIAAGLRDKIELDAVRKEGLFDHIIWIERPGVPIDITVTYEAKDCDSTILNNGTLDDYHLKIWTWAEERGLLKPLYLGGPCT